MAWPNDPEQIAWVNEFVRPLAESLRNDKVRIDDGTIVWDQRFVNDIPNDATVLDDGREAEGVSRLTGADIHQWVAEAKEMATNLNNQINDKPTVRELPLT